MSTETSSNKKLRLYAYKGRSNKTRHVGSFESDNVGEPIYFGLGAIKPGNYICQVGGEFLFIGDMNSYGSQVL